MTSREKILAAVKNNQPDFVTLPAAPNFDQGYFDLKEKFTTVLQSIGGKVHEANTIDEMLLLLKSQFGNEGRIITLIETFSPWATFYNVHEDPHLLENVEVAIIKAHFAVAENGAVWVTDELMPNRVLPFICQHLVVVLDKENIVSTMHDAYNAIGDSPYSFATFIAGPSKTADIEQSLVLGAHGPKTMTVLLHG